MNVHKSITKSGQVKPAAEETPVKEWSFDPSEILNSARKVRGKFHTPMVDKDKEYIEGEAVRNAVPYFMHLPILHDFHKERTVGIVTRVVELSDGSFDFEGLIKATDDCNDIWELISKGQYDQVSIYGKRVCGSPSCKLKPEQRREPCVTTEVRIDSISVCDDNARNDGTSLYVAKSEKVVYEATDEIIKAETTDSTLMHTVTDYPRVPKWLPQPGKRHQKKTAGGIKGDMPGYPRDELKAKEDSNVTAEEEKSEVPVFGRGIPKKGKGDSMGRNFKKKEEPAAEKKPHKTAGIREARPGDKKSTLNKGDEVEKDWTVEPMEDEPEAQGEDPQGESIEDKLDKLEMVIEGLVQKDEEEKGGYNKFEQPPASNADWGEELKPEEPGNFGLPEEGEGREESEVRPEYDEIDRTAAKIHLSKKVEEEKLAGTEEKGKIGFDQLASGNRSVPRITDKTSPEEVAHWKEMYEQGKPGYNQKQVAEKVATQASGAGKPTGSKTEPMVERDIAIDEEERPSEPMKRPAADSATVDAKASPDPARVRAERSAAGLPVDSLTDDEVAEKKKQDAADRERAKQPIVRNKGSTEASERQKNAKNPPWSGTKHSSTERGSREESSEVTSKIPPAGGQETTSKDVKVRATPANTTPTKQEGMHPFQQHEKEFPTRGSAEKSPDIHAKQGEHSHTAPNQKPATEARAVGAGSNEGGRFTPGQQRVAGESEPRQSNEPELKQYFANQPSGGKAPELKAGSEMGDINARLDRLIAIVAKLTQTDAMVHNDIGDEQKADPAEEKCKVCKGTDEMKDEEVDLLVKAKVASEVETISKAYMASLDELKKANANLEQRIAKMEEETIQKSGVAVILRPGDEELGTAMQTNAAAVSAISKARSKV